MPSISEIIGDTIRLIVRANVEENCPFKTSLFFLMASFCVHLTLYKCKFVCRKHRKIHYEFKLAPLKYSCLDEKSLKHYILSNTFKFASLLTVK